ncbi:MAG: hypothetical protein P8I44_10105, partial [Phycisphaerales bacterium]|nr:hypothetical protein [Phycisphaerales bacterium]
MTSGLRWWLRVVLLLFGILCIDSLYLAATDLAAWFSGASRENGIYLWAFLVHLVLGLLILVPFVVYGIGHARRGRFRPNRRAVAVGWGLLWIGVALLVTGVALVRVEVFGIRFGIDAPAVRSVIFWVHAASPLVAIWLFILHRLVGPRLRWTGGLAWGVGGVVTASLAFAVSTGTPVKRSPLDVPVALATSSTPAFAPSLLETAHGGTIPTEHLLGNEHCIECHADAHAQWADSVHASSSFNNPLYAFSV